MELSGRGGRVLTGILLGCTVGALAPGAGPARAGEDLTEAAASVASARKALDAAADAEKTAAERAVRADREQAAAAEAAAVARKAQDDARQTRVRAAKVARTATAEEGRAADEAAAARSELVRVVRSAYMSGSSGNFELQAFVDFAIDGPEALSGLASHTIAVERIENNLLADVDRTGRMSDEASAAAQAARSDFGTATDDEARARDALIAAKDELAEAQSAESAAAAERSRAIRARAKAQSLFSDAQSEFKKVLAESGGGAIASKEPPASSGGKAELVWSILIAEGFSEEAAAGVLGNLQQESNIDPTVIQFGGPGMGLAQWSRGGRWDTGPNSLLAWTSARGLDPWDAVAQTRFMIFEMENGWGGFNIDEYKKMTDVVAATIYFHDEFEGSADSSSFVRITRGGYAMHWYNEFKGA